MDEEQKQLLLAQTQKLNEILSLLQEIKENGSEVPPKIERMISDIRYEKQTGNQQLEYTITTEQTIYDSSQHPSYGDFVPPIQQAGGQSFQQYTGTARQPEQQYAGTIGKPEQQYAGTIGQTERQFAGTIGQPVQKNNNATQAQPYRTDRTPSWQNKASQAAAAQKKQKRREKISSLEFSIGTSLLSVLGAILILTALALLTIHYMDNTMQGIFLFAGPVLLILFSEFFLRKRIARFSAVLTSLGIAVLYLAVILNYVYLLKYSGVAAILGTVFVTIASMYLSLRNQSAVIRCLALIGGYISLITMGEPKTLTQLIVVILIVSIISLGNIILPLRKNNLAADFATNVLNLVLFTLLLYYRANAAFSGSTVTEWMISAYGVILLVTASILCLRAIWRLRASGNTRNIAPVIFYLGTLLYVLLMTRAVMNIYLGYIPHILTAFVFMYLGQTCGLRWMYYFQAALMTFMTVSLAIRNIAGNSLGTWLPWIGIAVITYILNRKVRNIYLTIWNYFFTLSSFIIFLFIDRFIISTIYIAIFWIFFFLPANYEMDENETFYNIACRYWVFLFSMIFGYRWLVWIKPYVTLTDQQSVVWVQSGLLLLFLILTIVIPLITTQVEGFHHKNQKTIHFAIFTTSVVAQIFVYHITPIAFICVFLLETLILLYLWREPIAKKLKVRELLFAFYVSYMYSQAQQIFQIHDAIIWTIGLMLIALLSVLYGCLKRIKNLRVFGLILTILISIKLIFFDLSKFDLLLKIVLFLIVGILTLVVSFIYNKMAKSGNEERPVLYYRDEADDDQKKNEHSPGLDKSVEHTAEAKVEADTAAEVKADTDMEVEVETERKTVTEEEMQEDSFEGNEPQKED